MSSGENSTSTAVTYASLDNARKRVEEEIQRSNALLTKETERHRALESRIVEHRFEKDDLDYIAKQWSALLKNSVQKLPVEWMEPIFSKSLQTS